ncbi:transmembrane protein 202 [Sorex araneus]|uniref:transmembrane protein 202 n=1 Tax=Sorex araneus TaxID=42254 RepID=UPI0024333EB2|nr:transmembrane protein 202 [Sorex araneus]
MAAQRKGREEVIMTFHIPKVPKIKGDRKYKRATLPTSSHPGASMSPQRRRHHVDQTHIYFRMFCGSLCGFGILMMLSTSPMNWVELLVIKSGHELYEGLWVTCSHELCWRQTETSSYYLQYSRATFIISALFILNALGCLIASCLPRRGGIVDNLDLKLSILSFLSAICLLLCLVLFLEQVNWHARDIMEVDFLWTYHLNCWCDLLYTLAGIISFLNHLHARQLPEQNVSAKPVEKSRLGVGPVTEAELFEVKGPALEKEALPVKT